MPAMAAAALIIAARVMRLSEMSPMVGNIAMSLSATYHCTAAVAATGVTMALGSPTASWRMTAQNMVEPLAPPTPMMPSIAPDIALGLTILPPPLIMVCAASARDNFARASHAIPDA